MRHLIELVLNVVVRSEEFYPQTPAVCGLSSLRWPNYSEYRGWLQF